jgi:DNA polymerase III subunit epsilon
MSLDFVAIDFETASNQRGSACAVGLAVVRGGRIVDSYYSLMNPMCAFTPQCIRIHGIREADVADAPTFPQIWDDMLRHMGGLPLIAHNASFDMGVLERLFSIWQVDPAYQKYACTLKLSRALCTGASSHRLPDICDYFHLPDFAHHNAGDDARACALICLAMARRIGADSMDDLLRAAGLRWSAMLSSNYFPEDPDGERLQNTPGHQGAPVAQEDHFACGPVFEGMSFVFTGELASMERLAAQKAVELRAGTVLGGVSKKTNVLVVGVQDPGVVHGPFSTKHGKALELKEKGCSIRIIDENAFLDWLHGDLPKMLRR